MASTTDKGLLSNVFDRADHIQIEYSPNDGSGQNLAVVVPKSNCFASFILAAAENGFNGIEVDRDPSKPDTLRSIRLGAPEGPKTTVYDRHLE